MFLLFNQDLIMNLNIYDYEIYFLFTTVRILFLKVDINVT